MFRVLNCASRSAGHELSGGCCRPPTTNDLYTSTTRRERSGLLIARIANRRKLKPENARTGTLNGDAEWIRLSWGPSSTCWQTVDRDTATSRIHRVTRMTTRSVASLAGSENPVHCGIWTSNVCEQITGPHQASNKQKKKSVFYLHSSS